MKIGILGCGAVGYSLMHEIYDTFPDIVYICAPLRYYSKLNSEVIINEKAYNFKVSKNDIMDYIFICVKNYDLERSLDDIKSFINEDTVIIPLLNGVVARDKITAKFKNRTFYGAIKVEANKLGNEYVVSKINKLFFGYENNEVLKPEVLSLKRVLDDCNINNEVSLDMKRSVWLKYMLNLGINQVSALTNSSYRDMHHPFLQEMLYNLFIEAVNVASKLGVDLKVKDACDMLKETLEWNSRRVTSLTLDFQNKRRNELDYFSKTLIDFARKLDVDVPYNTFFYKLLKSICDNMND